MKLFTTQLFLIVTLLLLGCKKDNDEPKPQIADLEFSLYDLKIPTDAIATDINYPSTLILKKDYTWTLDLNGAKSNGTYSWSPTEDYRASVNFTIEQWTPLSSDIELSNKLKSVLETVTNCGFPGPNITSLNFFENTYTTTLRTNKK